MPVMPTSVAPSRSMRSISAAVSSLGPFTAPYTPPSVNGQPADVAASRHAAQLGAYGCVKSTCTTLPSPPSKNVASRPEV
jgi:hypothetical protein